MSDELPKDKANDPKFERLGYKEQVLDIINGLKLSSETDKSILKSRFLYEVLNYDMRRNHTKKYYNGFRFIVTVGSILLPAILSIGQMDPAKLPKNFDTISYWVSWTISLLVTASNGFLQLFSLDKNLLLGLLVQQYTRRLLLVHLLNIQHFVAMNNSFCFLSLSYHDHHNPTYTMHHLPSNIPHKQNLNLIVV